MSRKKPAPGASPPSQSALFVRLPTTAVDKLDRAAEVLGMRKKDLVEGLVSRYVDPDSRRSLDALGSLSKLGFSAGFEANGPPRGSYSFHPYDLPEVMNAEQAAAFLQIEEATLLELAEAGQLPGRRLGPGWRFSRAALVAWLSTPGAP